ncbi:glycosyltransferase [Rhodovulum sulfidophilum]|uniref:glycosyltransferase n=1 Tax=Rhodovulum sulfidophilum TaxID=35806 RepID=UPI00138A35DF|nr:glycosyltransferase [Rhodovulum sulfidophilum]NDK35560.1 glycosyltransferase [Rhodovulum sulfidophilum]
MTTSRLAAMRRVLRTFFWMRMCGRRTGFALRFDHVRPGQLDIRAADGVIRIAATAARAARIGSEAATVLLAPDEEGRIRHDLPGMRFLIWHDVRSGLEIRVPLYRAHDYVLGGLRAALSLILFPFRHGADLIGYFLKGDSAAGDRLERALLPQLAAADHPPDAATGLFGAGPMPPLTEPVDIILPVYNAADVLALCLERIAANTPEPHRLILIDDASPDPRVRPLLEDFVRRHPQARLLVNLQNLGFIGTVNRGLAEARGHVVLLNSDALVPPGWLTRLMAPILDDASIASVTPLSNDAEIFDVPVECRARPLGPGEAEAADRAAARLNWRSALCDAPVGVGFCMAMARHWLELLPDLDTAFGRGYGEEVDWCRKAAALGARHVCAAHLFVEHRSGSSFGAEKAERVRTNNRLISNRYPGYDLMVQQFRDKDPLVGPRLAVGIGMLGQGAPLRIYLAHRLGGGSEFWLQTRIEEVVTENGAALVVRDAPGSDRLQVELYCREGVTRSVLDASDLAAMLAGLDARHLVYSNLVAAEDPLGLMERALSWLAPGDRLSVLFHDFLPLCPSYTLIGSKGRFCGLPGPEACQACYARLAVTSGKRPAAIDTWRAGWRKVMDRADELIAFSEDSRAQLARVWPDLAGRIELQPHRPEHLPRRIVPPPEGPLTVGVLGSIGHNKGAAILHDLAQHAAPDLGIVVIGKIDPAFAHHRIRVHGAYRREEIADLAEHYRIRCWLIPSIWPETFCFAVHETLATGLPVFVYDIGAQAGAAAAAINGHLLPLGCEGAALDRHLRRHLGAGVTLPPALPA